MKEATATLITKPIKDSIMNLKNCLPMPLVSLLSNVQNLFHE
jgi:hypothetical protein